MPNDYVVEVASDTTGNLILNAEPDISVIEVLVAGPQGPAGSGTGGTGTIGPNDPIDGGSPTTTTFDGTVDGGTP